MEIQDIKSTVLILPQHMVSTYVIHLFNKKVSRAYNVPGAVLRLGTQQ